LNIDKLKSFYATVKKGSVKSAAQYYGCSVSGITRHIASLEEEVGHKLFNNINQRLVLTNKGELLFDRVGKILAEFDAAIRCLDEDGNDISGDMILNIAAAVTGIGIIDYLAPYIASYPKLNVRIICSDQEVDLGMREADVAIRPSMDNAIGLIQEHVTSCPIHLFASEEYVRDKGLPKEPKDLGNHRLITHYPTGNLSLRHLNWHTQFSDSANYSTIAINSGVGVLAAVENGVGIGTISELALKGAKHNLVRVFPHLPSPTIDLYYIYPEELAVTARISLLRRHLLAAFEHPPKHKQGAA
jgi:DNA-binding transcriptional LysR family regulator